jgi:hypothetical protein
MTTAQERAAQFAAERQAEREKPKGFTPTDNKAKREAKTDRPAAAPQPAPSAAASTAIPTARETALALSSQSHKAMSALQGAGLENAAAYLRRKQQERNEVVDKVSDAIAYLSDPDLLEADIMSAAAAKVQARSGAWGYADPAMDLDNLFALPVASQRLLGGS